MSRRSIAAFAGALLAAVATTIPAVSAGAATFGAGSSGPITLTLESYMPTISATGTATLNSMVSTFEQSHPNIKVTVNGEASTNIAADVQRQEVAGQTPDVVQVVFDSMNFAINDLGAVSLEKIAGPAAVKAAFGGDHPFTAAAAKLGEYKGKTYGIPWTLSTPILFYNASLFQQAGLDPNSPPKTWDEVVTDADAIKTKTGAEGLSAGVAGVSSGSNDCFLQAAIDSDGGSVLAKNGKTVTFNTRAVANALEPFRKMAQAGSLANLTTSQIAQEFGSNKLGMVFTSSALQSTLLTAAGDKFIVMDAAMPSYAGHAPKPVNSGSGLFIFTKDKAKQKAAWELIKSLTDDASQTAITENIGYPPLRTSLVNDDKYLKSWKHTSTLVIPNINQLQIVTPWAAYPGPNFTQIETDLVNAAGDVVFQGSNAQRALGQAESQAKELSA
ncbi:MAG TPA: extracellular solute-binding protein [Acidimicrobiales bacterium]|jgi:multiple sugar transport system substrate-binding protein|nr:extracellular solute-binding protein [Acidimicrobiales bacterium]